VVKNNGHLLASYDVEVAKELGLPAAALLNKLNYLAKFTRRKDGYCWKNAKDLYAELGITKRQQMEAVKKLEKAGLIKTKVTYIQDGRAELVRCKHFFVFGVSNAAKDTECELSESNKMSLSTESNKMSLSESNKMSLSIESDKTALSSISNNITNNKDINNNINNNIKESAYYPNDEVLNDTFKDYIEMRKKIRAPMTDKAIKLAINTLNKLSGGDNEKAIQILNQSIFNGWRGLFPLKEERTTTGNSKPQRKSFADIAREEGYL
jgi:hypothetical protein